MNARINFYPVDLDAHINFPIGVHINNHFHINIDMNVHMNVYKHIHLNVLLNGTIPPPH